MSNTTNQNQSGYNQSQNKNNHQGGDHKNNPQGGQGQHSHKDDHSHGGSQGDKGKH